MKNVTIKLPDHLRARLEAEAERRGRSLGWVVREAAEIYVASAATAEPPTALDALREFVGIQEGRVSDLATNPRHMEGFGRDAIAYPRHRSAHCTSGKKRKVA